MCTAIYDNKCGAVLGRTLDLELTHGEKYTTLDAGVEMKYIYLGNVKNKYRIGGTAHTVGGVPLFYDGMNECGLGIVALNFPRCAVYLPPHSGYINLGSFELIPYILGECRDISEAEEMLLQINITADSFSDSYPATPLHFMLADKERALIVEPREDGLVIYDTEVGIMTNAPSYDYHIAKLSEFHALTNKHPKGVCGKELYSRGMGAMGLPGDWSSSSRFVRADFVKKYISSRGDPVSRFFHIADTIEVPHGCIITDNGDEVYTVYTACMDLEKLTYNFRTYDDRVLTSFKL